MTGAVSLLTAGRAAFVTVTPDTASGFGQNNVIITNTVTATIDYPDVSWMWTVLADTGIIANSPTNATTDFRATLSPGERVESNARVEARFNGQVVGSALIYVEIERTS